MSERGHLKVKKGAGQEIPSSKIQSPNKFQSSNSKFFTGQDWKLIDTSNSVRFLELGIWSLFVIWILELGISWSVFSTASIRRRRMNLAENLGPKTAPPVVPVTRDPTVDNLEEAPDSRNEQ
ncbi:MAG: hypothetical protein PHX83_17665 [Acidobacteriia bacterium]|nr:hypothetical protein [Terriglobia bacterium]